MTTASLEIELSKYHPVFQRNARFRRINPTDAAEIWQDVAAACVECRTDFDDWATPMGKACLKTIVQRRIADFLKRIVRSKINREIAILDEIPVPNDAYSPERSIELADMYYSVHAYLARLDNRSSSVLREHYLNGRSLREISQHNNEPINTVRTREKRARKKLRQLLLAGGFTP